jgi:hypothetical protein
VTFNLDSKAGKGMNGGERIECFTCWVLSGLQSIMFISL